MTCGQPYRCVLCEPPTLEGPGRNELGQFARRWSRHLIRDKTYVFVEGRLSMEQPGKRSLKPHLEYCPGCVERALGRKPREGEVIQWPRNE